MQPPRTSNITLHLVSNASENPFFHYPITTNTKEINYEWISSGSRRGWDVKEPCLSPSPAPKPCWKHVSKTRKHSSRMRTARFCGWGGMKSLPVWSHVLSKSATEIHLLLQLGKTDATSNNRLTRRKRRIDHEKWWKLHYHIVHYNKMM